MIRQFRKNGHFGQGILRQMGFWMFVENWEYQWSHTPLQEGHDVYFRGFLSGKYQHKSDLDEKDWRNELPRFQDETMIKY